MSDADSDLHVFTRCDFEGERSQNENLEEGFLGCLANREPKTRPRSPTLIQSFPVKIRRWREQLREENPHLSQSRSGNGDEGGGGKRRKERPKD